MHDLDNSNRATRNENLQTNGQTNYRKNVVVNMIIKFNLTFLR